MLKLGRGGLRVVAASVLALVLVLGAGGGLACGYEVRRSFCAADAFHVDLTPPPIVLGCRVQGCCPGCDPSAPLDVRVDVEGTLPLRLRGRVGTSAIGAGPGGEQAGTEFKTGATLIAAAAVAEPGGAAPLPLLTTEAVLDAASVVEAGRLNPVLPFASAVVGRLAVTITQLQGSRVVATDRYVAEAVVCPTQRPGSDRIEIERSGLEAAGDEAVLIVRGARAGRCVAGEIWRGKGLIYIGNMESAPQCPADLALFSRGHAALLRWVGGPPPLPGPAAAPGAAAPAVAAAAAGVSPGPAPATAAAQTAAAGAGASPAEPAPTAADVAARGWGPGLGERLKVETRSPPLALPLDVVLLGDGAERDALEARSRFDIAVANRALDRARCGIRLADSARRRTAPHAEADESAPAPEFELKEVKSDPAAVEAVPTEQIRLALESEGADRCARLDAALRGRAAPEAPAVVAVYVAGLPLATLSCPDQGLVVLGALAQPESLAHGVGHLLGLEHAGLGSSNLMAEGALGRTAFALGQCFVASFDPRSVVNRWKLRVGAIRSCGAAAEPGACPPPGLDVGLD